MPPATRRATKEKKAKKATRAAKDPEDKSIITFRRLLLLISFLLLLLLPASPALAEEATPRWTVTSVSRPTNFRPGDETGDDSYLVTVTNTGGASSNGEPVVITDELPAGLSFDPVGGSGENPVAIEQGQGVSPRAGFSCVLRTCAYTGVVVPDQTLTFAFPVDVAVSPPASCGEVPAGATGCVTNVVRVAGGGAPDASMSAETAISEHPAGFGISPGGATTALSSTQAGAHPDLTTSIAFNTQENHGALAGDPKDTTDQLPPGFAGDLVDTPACPIALLALRECPVGTQVGFTTLTLDHGGVDRFIEPVYNVSPNPGETAKLGFSAGGIANVQGNVTVRPGDYGLETTFENVDEGLAELDSLSLTVWGVPASPLHDPLRWSGPAPQNGGHFGAPSATARVPFFTSPTTCATRLLVAEFSVTSWEHPNASESPAPTEMPFGPLIGCDRLGMTPSLTAEATSDAAYSPTGFDLDTSIPQTYENPEGLATSALKREVVTLPEGMTVNPSSGAGLQACSEAQYAEEGVAAKTALQKEEGKGCPNSSKLATVKIKTPSLAEEVTGSAYLAEPAPRGALEPGKNPFNTLLALYLVARAADRGILVKAPGKVEPNLETGRLTTTFGPTPAFDGGQIPASEGLPPLPASDISFAFNQGANAPLVTPPTCGSFEVKAALTPWSSPASAPPLTPLIPPFPIDANCPAGNVPPFNPGVTAYSLHGNAGAYSPLYLKITRNDGEQEITGFSTQFPPGLTGNLSGVAECGEAEVQRARGQTGVEAETSPACPQSSEIGYSIAEAGVGTVLAQTPGKIYLGGPMSPEGPNHPGAPFSVVSITAAHVGPFDLGTVVIHFPLDINPETADVTIPAGVGGANQIPHIINGIVIHVRNIRVYISRNDFMLNPTSCGEQKLSATVLGNGPVNNGVTVSDPFQTADCSSLKFEPKFSASTESKDSFNNLGASLKVNLTANQGPNQITGQGVEANIHSVKVELPGALPSRLTTLQKACLAKVFEANPAACPPASNIGHAVVHTPILPVPLEGPAIFVSHGGEAFPSLILVLQGYGVTIDLTGATFISHAGITSSTFKTVPDQPFSTFELVLPTSKFSALAAITNVCKPVKTETVKKKVSVKRHGKSVKVTKKVSETVAAPLLMPTEMVAQNGAVIHQSTPISVSGCPKAKTAAQLRAAKLAAALKACHKKKGSKRSSCEKAARKRYNPLKKKPSHKK